MKYTSIFAVAVMAVIFTGCTAVDNANPADAGKLAKEGTIVFTRPAQFTPFFGSHSISEFVEIVYENVSRNEAGFLVVEVGIRNRGPVLWTNWHVRAPKRLTLKARCNFYRGSIQTPMVYSTNARTIVVPKGETYAYRAVCPVKDATNYQLVLGD